MENQKIIYKRARPTVAINTQNHVKSETRSLKNSDAISGVSTIYKPVTKPVIAAPVRARPRV